MEGDLDGKEAQKRAKQTRATTKSNLTKIRNSIREVLKGQSDAGTVILVEEKRVRYQETSEKLREANQAYVDLLSEEEEREDGATYIEAVEITSAALMREIESWAQAPAIDRPDVEPEDSASQTSSRSGSAVSSRANVAAKGTALAVKAASLEKRQAIQMSEFRLTLQKEELELQTAIAMAKAEEEAYAHAEKASDGDEEPQLRLDTNGHPPGRSDVPPRTPGTPPDTHELRDPPDDDSDDFELEFESRLNPQASEWIPSGENKKDSSHTVITQIVEQGERQQRQLLEALHLPRAELTSFDGDPLTYWTFIRAFENSVDSSSLSASTKLTRLLQYCEGRAKQLIRCCSVMDPKQGYPQALRMLKERFGDDHIIAEAWVEKVTTGGIIPQFDRQGLRDYADDLRSCQVTLNSMGYASEMNNQKVLVSIAERLPNYLRSRWVREARSIRVKSGKSPTMDDLVVFIVGAAEEANDPVYGRLNSRGKDAGYASTYRDNPKNTGSKVRGRGTSINVATEEVGDLCLKCKSGKHSLFQCDEFKALKPGDRLSFARKANICFNCLKRGHRAEKCQLTRACSISGCGRKHTKFLHLPNGGANYGARQPEMAGAVQGSNRVVSMNAETICASTGAGAKRVALPIVSVNVFAKGGASYVPAYALLDTCSTSSFCTERLAEKLGIQSEEQLLSLTTLESKSSVTKTRAVELEVVGAGGSEIVGLSRVYTRPEIPVREENMARMEDLMRWPHLKDLGLPQVDHIEVDLLIGQDAPEALVPLEVRRGKRGEPYATRTSLGWALGGPLDRQMRTDKNHVTSHFLSASDGNLENQLKMFWKIDGNENVVQGTKSMSVNDKRVMSIWEDTVCLKDGQYELAIPFKQRPPNLANNMEMAQKRLESLGRRLRKDPKLHERYREGMQEVLDKGQAQIVRPNGETLGAVWYLPHHPVVNPMKPDKVRIVYDYAAKFQGVSLNDQVLQGPDMTNKLLGVLLRFREERVALMADIEAMFHQVRVPQSDRDVLRFLWWPVGDMAREPQEYQMGVHLFGGTWSPSCCNSALQRTADDNRHDYHEDTIDTVRHNFYVDDCLKSIKDEDKASQLCEELTSLLSKGGFVLSKWLSNSHEVLAKIPDKHRAKCAKGIDFNHEAPPTERALGVYWDAQEDCFSYKFSLKDKPTNRRGLLSVVSSVYDPLGFACPFTIRAKALIHDLCRMGLDWDTPIPREHAATWASWKNEIPKLEEVKIDRCLTPREFQGTLYELHHFADASEMAYGAVSYLRAVGSNGNRECKMVIAKAHLAPLKQMTIPRLELTAATLAVKLDAMLRLELGIVIDNSFFWTYSTVVLQYIANTDKRFHTFVSNRLALIHDGSNTNQWRHVPSELNPADDISRGMTSQDLMGRKRWAHGPDFLWQDEDQWPVGHSISNLVDDKEMKSPKDAARAYMTQPDESSAEGVIERLFNHFSSWYKLKKITALILRARNYLRQMARQLPVPKMLGPVTIAEMRNAELQICRYLQQKYFPSEMKLFNVRSNRTTEGLALPKGSSLYRLNPFMSDDGLLRVGGRLKHSPLPESARYPIILPKGNRDAELIVEDYHVLSGHSGREYVHALLQERFWLMGARSMIRQVIKGCIVCFRVQRSRK